MEDAKISLKTGMKNLRIGGYQEAVPSLYVYFNFLYKEMVVTEHEEIYTQNVEGRNIALGLFRKYKHCRNLHQQKKNYLKEKNA